MRETVFALASAQGKAGVAVVRVSGPGALGSVSALTAAVEPRQATLRTLYDGDSVIDHALVIAFPGPGSFTGEDVVEFQLHGSQATVAALLSFLSRLEGFRPAEAGEFTRRALENERLDLPQIEGLADLVEAETEAQRLQALRVLSGSISEQTRKWRQHLIRAAALVEATLDFADEEVPENVWPEVRNLLSDTAKSLVVEIEAFGAAERVRAGFEIAIVGPPNVGKSTLLNALAGRDAAITSDIAGTTRDAIEVRMDIEGIPVTVVDTAGVRETDDRIETLGVQRALDRAAGADLRIILHAEGEPPVVSPSGEDLVLIPKADLGSGDFSAVTGFGLNTVLERVSDALKERAASAGLLVRERHKSAVVKAAGSLEDAIDRIDSNSESSELVADDIRRAIVALDSLVGHVGVEDLLDEIFSSFCIGK